jgi:hypothetical protein
MDVNTNVNASQTAAASKHHHTPPANPAATSAETTQPTNEQNTVQDVVEISGKKPSSSRSPANMAAINEALAQHQRQVDAFKDMIQRLLYNQAHTARTVNGQVMIEIDEETRLKAQADIAEDGYFGVKQTSERILSFARAFAGDDPERIKIMRDAFIAGYEAAEKIWGGELPEISRQTFDAVMRGFDEMLGISPKEEE